MCELISPRQLLFSQKYFLNIFFSPQAFGGDFVCCSFPEIFSEYFFHHKLLVETSCAAFFPEIFSEYFFTTSF